MHIFKYIAFYRKCKSWYIWENIVICIDEQNSVLLIKCFFSIKFCQKQHQLTTWTWNWNSYVPAIQFSLTWNFDELNRLSCDWLSVSQLLIWFHVFLALVHSVFLKKLISLNYCTVGGITHICFKQWFQITADAHPGVPGVSKDQKFCEKFKNTHCQVDHPAKIE